MKITAERPQKYSLTAAVTHIHSTALCVLGTLQCDGTPDDINETEIGMQFVQTPAAAC